MGRPAGENAAQTEQSQELRVRLDGFAWETIVEESERLGVPVEELAQFSVLYYLADLDSGRIARRLPTSSSPSGRKRS